MASNRPTDPKLALAAYKRAAANANAAYAALEEAATAFATGRADRAALLDAARKATNAGHEASRARKRCADIKAGEV